MGSVPQEPMEEIDLSITLRQLMAVRRLSVGEMAKLAGVSKSAMEKYLAGPSSPRFVAIASLSRALGLSIDQIAFGEFDMSEQLLYEVAFTEIWGLISDLKTDPALWSKFEALAPGSVELSNFARDLAYMRAVKLKARYREELREEHIGTRGVAL